MIDKLEGDSECVFSLLFFYLSLSLYSPEKECG